jgi:RNA polymerase sigma factor (sigma-70 family)
MIRAPMASCWSRHLVTRTHSRSSTVATPAGCCRSSAGGSAEVAFDLTAETFAAALEAAPRYEPRPDPARGWLYGIAFNKLYEAQRRGRADDAVRRALGMQPIELTDKGLERIETLAGEPATHALHALPDEQREAVRARVLDERPYEEIAGELGCSESVVRQRVSRGMRAMRARLKEVDG